MYSRTYFTDVLEYVYPLIALLWVGAWGTVSQERIFNRTASLSCVVELRGLPKTGTTWTELVVKSIMDFHCQMLSNSRMASSKHHCQITGVGPLARDVWMCVGQSVRFAKACSIPTAGPAHFVPSLASATEAWTGCIAVYLVLFASTTARRAAVCLRLSEIGRVSPPSRCAT